MSNELRTLFQDIADAIKDKTGSTDTMKPAEFPSKIAEISVGEGAVVEKDINFFDYDGTLLYSYTIAEANALMELPPLPEQEGLICQGWNYSIEDVKNATYPMTIGAVYITDDGKTRIYIHNEFGSRGKVWFCVSQTVANGTTIDWGDGSQPEIITFSGGGTFNHIYSEPGDYIVTFDVASGCELTLGSGSTTLVNNNSSSKASIRRVHIGKNVTGLSYAFEDCQQLQYITIPNGLTTFNGNDFYKAYSLKSVIIPNGVTKFGYDTFKYCYNMSVLSLPNTITNLLMSTCEYCYSLRHVHIPKNVLELQIYVFRYCYSLQKITIPSSITKFSGSVFSYCAALKSVTIMGDISNTSCSDMFNSCYSLKEVMIHGDVFKVGSNFFKNCYTLTDITLPNETTLSTSMFENCYTLQHIKIPKSVTTIPATCMKYCSSLAEVDFSDFETVPSLSATTAFASVSGSFQLKVPAALYDEWKSATNWSTYASKIVAV